jgi:hypothetical protein
VSPGRQSIVQNHRKEAVSRLLRSAQSGDGHTNLLQMGSGPSDLLPGGDASDMVKKSTLIFISAVIAAISLSPLHANPLLSPQGSEKKQEELLSVRTGTQNRHITGVPAWKLRLEKPGR